MTLENLPVWSFEPDWSEKVSETFEWLTKVLRSRTGAEQRRALRYTPRRYVEYASMLHQDRRTLFDNTVNGIGIGDYYLPLWHEAYPVAQITGAALSMPSVAQSDIRSGSVLWLQGDDKGEIREVDRIVGTIVFLTGPTAFEGQSGIIAHPAQRARFTELPRLSRRTDALGVAQGKFQMIGSQAQPGEDVDLSGLSQLSTYRDRPLFLMPPDERENLDYGYERIIETIDNRTSVPRFVNVSPVPFTTQKYTWRIVGQEEYRKFVKLLYAIRGRLTAFYMPTFFSDFELTRSFTAGSGNLYVRNTGFSTYAKALKNRQDICIEYADGSHHCTRIAGANVVDEHEERLVLADPAPAGIPVMISFLVESRFDQDIIELAHDTDTAGVTVASILIRGTPTFRRALPTA